MAYVENVGFKIYRLFVFIGNILTYTGILDIGKKWYRPIPTLVMNYNHRTFTIDYNRSIDRCSTIKILR